jgi:hypothetical protein
MMQHLPPPKECHATRARVAGRFVAAYIRGLGLVPAGRGLWTISENYADALAAVVAADRRPVMSQCEIAGLAVAAGIPVMGEAELRQIAALAVARIEARIEAAKHAGEMQSVNRAYRKYRIEANARNRKAKSFSWWLADYKARMIETTAQIARAKDRKSFGRLTNSDLPISLG